MDEGLTRLVATPRDSPIGEALVAMLMHLTRRTRESLLYLQEFLIQGSGFRVDQLDG